MKKKWKRNVLLLCSIAGCCLAACTKDAPSTNTTASQASLVTFTINGDGHVNEKITINGLATVPENEGEYFSKHGFTNINVGDNAAQGTLSKNSLHCSVDGHNEGTQIFGAAFSNNGGTQVEVNLILTLTSSTGVKKIYDSNTEVFGYQPKGTITITHYNEVNETIEGTFTGKMANDQTGELITITNGTFAVPRHKDIPL